VLGYASQPPIPLLTCPTFPLIQTRLPSNFLYFFPQTNFFRLLLNFDGFFFVYNNQKLFFYDTTLDPPRQQMQ
jgi:hypothetical protein